MTAATSMHRLSAAERELVAANVRLVPWALRKWTPPPGHDFDDVVGVGYVGLMVAAQRFDPTLGNKFSTFAVACIRNEVSAWIRHLNRVKRGGSGRNSGTSTLRSDLSLDYFHEVGFDPPADDAGTAGVEDELFVDDILRRAADLDPRLPAIIADRMDGATLQAAGNRHGLCSERVRQLLLLARDLAPAMEVA